MPCRAVMVTSRGFPGGIVNSPLVLTVVEILFASGAQAV